MIRLENASSNVKILQDISIVCDHKLHRFLPEANNCSFNRSFFLSVYIDEKLIYLNCWLNRSLKCTISQFLALSNNMKKGLNGTRTLIAAMPVQCFTSSAIRLIKSWSVCRSMSPNNDQLPVGPIAPLVEHFTGMTEFRVRALFRPEFFRPYSPLLK